MTKRSQNTIVVYGVEINLESDKAGYLLQVAAKAAAEDPSFVGRGKLCAAMVATAKNQTEGKSHSNGVARYFGDAERFIQPLSMGGRLEGVIANALLAIHPEARKWLAPEQLELFGQIPVSEVAAFIKAASTASYQTPQGTMYGIEAYSVALADSASKDAQMLLGVFGLEDPTETNLRTVVSTVWHEGGPKAKGTSARRFCDEVGIRRNGSWTSAQA